MYVKCYLQITQKNNGLGLGRYNLTGFYALLFVSYSLRFCKLYSVVITRKNSFNVDATLSFKLHSQTDVLCIKKNKRTSGGHSPSKIFWTVFCSCHVTIFFFPVCYGLLCVYTRKATVLYSSRRAYFYLNNPVYY